MDQRLLFNTLEALDLEREKNRQLEDLIEQLQKDAVLTNSLALCGNQATAYNALRQYGQVSKSSMYALLYRRGEPEIEGDLRGMICALRKKLPNNERIVTVWGWGWRLETTEAAPKKAPKRTPQPINSLGVTWPNSAYAF